MQSERDSGGPPAPGAALSTHLNEAGEVHMVDVGAKAPTLRRARAEAEVKLGPDTLDRLRRGDAPKGDVLATARIAGIQAAKRTPELIPLCHQIALTRVELSLDLFEGGVRVTATAEAFDRTGVEMEAMVAASVAALTLYDMLKGVERGISYSVRLVEKTGGRSGTWRPEPAPGG
jgi:molybdenum cofactor biosynthesis protein MoaC